MDFLETLNNPSMLHAAVVHIPIALAVVGVPLVYLCTVVARDNEVLRWVTVGCYLTLTLCAFVARQSGEGAVERVPPEVSQAVWNQIENHESMGKVVWRLALITAALLALSAIKIRWFNLTVLTLAMLASLGTGAWVTLTGHYGGMLVYEHGVGTPAMLDIGREGSSPTQPGPAGPVSSASDVVAPAADPARFSMPPQADGLEPALLPFTMEEARQVSYERDVRPILAEVCEECHHPGKERGDLDVTTVESLLYGGKKAGPAVIPGNPDGSPMIQYIRGELSPQMPKGELPLMDEELRTLRMWIAAGAIDDSAPPRHGGAEATVDIPEVPAGEGPEQAESVPEAPF